MRDQSTHIVSGYDTDLKSLTHALTDLGTLVSEMVEGAMRAFKKRDSVLAEKIIARDSDANKRQHKIDEDVQRIIALRNPVAQDLRRIIGATRIASDLERVGDLAEGIAKRALLLNEEPRIDMSKSVYRMGKQVRKQLSGALDTLLKEDAISALHYWQADSDIDDLYNSIFRELVTVMMGDPRTIPACAELLFVAKNLERIGDHATNICEAIYFTAKADQLINDPSLAPMMQDPGVRKTL
ncbi:phosphate signaling complex protein PhoU [Litorimonas sp. WD9-15]|uniref:phosphate signaling complex protein PhoU n=1 Tax=Litorimonas sp. WD9-15 TaxID=3418716 RepID=UPI003D091D8E